MGQSLPPAGVFIDTRRFLCQANGKMVLGRRTGQETAWPRADALSRTGFGELAAGLLFSIMGASYLVQPFRPGMFTAIEAAKWFVLFPLFAVMMWGRRALKRRFAGGFIEPTGSWWPAQREKLSREWSFVSLAVVVAFFLVFLVEVAVRGMDFDRRWLGAGFAVCIALQVLMEGCTRRSALLIAFAAYLLCLAGIEWQLPAAIDRFAVMEAGAGAPWAIAGAIRLRSVLKANPATPSPSPA